MKTLKKFFEHKITLDVLQVLCFISFALYALNLTPSYLLLFWFALFGLVLILNKQYSKHLQRGMLEAFNLGQKQALLGLADKMDWLADDRGISVDQIRIASKDIRAGVRAAEGNLLLQDAGILEAIQKQAKI